MSWTDIADVALDDGIFFQTTNEILANLLALKEFSKGKNLGGDPKATYVATSFTLVDDPIYIELDATNLGGMTYELHFMGQATSGDTITVELVTDPTGTPTQVVAKTFTNTTLDLVKSDAFTLTAGVNKYAVRVKATTGGVASPFIAYGFSLVQK